MELSVDIDDTDSQILTMLIQDVRMSLKEIARECGISSVSVLNRVKKLRKLGVITGATLFASLDIFGFEIVASIGIDLEAKADVHKISRFFSEHTYLVEPSASIGKHDFHAVVYAENIANLNDCVNIVRRLRGVLKVTVYVWSEFPSLNFDNINLMQARR